SASTRGGSSSLAATKSSPPPNCSGRGWGYRARPAGKRSTTQWTRSSRRCFHARRSGAACAPAWKERGEPGAREVYRGRWSSWRRLMSGAFAMRINNQDAEFVYIVEQLEELERAFRSDPLMDTIHREKRMRLERRLVSLISSDPEEERRDH